MTVRGGGHPALMMITGIVGYSTLTEVNVSYGRGIGLMPLDVTFYRFVAMMAATTSSSIVFPTYNRYLKFTTYSAAAAGMLSHFVLYLPLIIVISDVQNTPSFTE